MPRDASAAVRSAAPAAAPAVTGRLLLLALGSFAVATTAFLIAGVLPDISRSLHVPQTTASLLVTVYSVVFALAAPLIAQVAQRAPRTGLMVGGLAVMVVGTVLTAFLPTIATVLVARGVSALGAAAFVPTATAAAAAIVPPDQRGRAIATVMAGLTTAVALGAPLGTALAALGSWRTPLLVAAVLGVVVAAGVALLLRDVPPPPPTTLAQRFAPLGNRTVALALLTILVLTAGQYGPYVFLADVDDRATGGSGTVLALLLLAYGVAATAGNLGAGRIVDRRGDGTVIGIGLAVLILDFAAMPLAAPGLWPTVA